MQKHFELFVAKKLLKALGCPGAHFSLRQTNLGIHNHVFFLDIDGMAPLVLKGIKKHNRFKELLHSSEYLAKNGVTVPKVVYATSEGLGFLKRTRLNIICEERITGKTLQENKISDETAAKASKFLFSMHNIKRSLWGKIEEGKDIGLYEYLCKKIEEKIRKWQKLDPLFPEDVDKKVFSWINLWQTEIENLQSFSLSHCDVNPGNIILNNENQMYLLDTGHIRYLPPAIDFYTLQLQLCKDKHTEDVFECAYFEKMSGPEIADFKTLRMFFKMYVLVGFASMLAERIKHCLPGDPFYDQLPGYLIKVKKMVTAQADRQK